MRHLDFAALGTRVVVAVSSADDLARAASIARRTVQHVDVTCSRFRADADLSRVNRAPGRWVSVDPLLVAGVRTALEAARRTDGLVNPLLGRDLVELGYDRDLAALTDEGPDLRWETGARRDDLTHRWREIGLRDAAIRIPEDTALDLGSVGKAWAADLVVAAWEDAIAGAAAVSVGGDVAVTAGAPAWPVDLEGPSQRVELSGGGLASSSTRIRRWRRGGVVRHHLLDPRTGRPVPEVWHQVSASGPSCVAANTATTCAMVLGPAAPRWLTEHGVSARLVTGDGRTVLTHQWPAPVRDDDRRSA